MQVTAIGGWCGNLKINTSRRTNDELNLGRWRFKFEAALSPSLVYITTNRRLFTSQG